MKNTRAKHPKREIEILNEFGDLHASLEPNHPIDVYYNFQRKCFSIRQYGKVIAHVLRVAIKFASFIVSQAGRTRVLKNKRKNVHAYVRGFATTFHHLRVGKPVWYDPYHTPNYMTSCNLNSPPLPICGANYVSFQMESDHPRVLAIWLPNSMFLTYMTLT